MSFMEASTVPTEVYIILKLTVYCFYNIHQTYTLEVINSTKMLVIATNWLIFPKVHIAFCRFSVRMGCVWIIVPSATK